jgi:hypothetical protein
MRILICNIKSCTIKSPTVLWFKRWEHDEKNNMTIREKKEGRSSMFEDLQTYYFLEKYLVTVYILNQKN